MNAMIKEVLSHGNFGGFQTSALVIFVILMSLVCLWIFLPGSRTYYERIASDITKEAGHD